MKQHHHSNRQESTEYAGVLLPLAGTEYYHDSLPLTASGKITECVAQAVSTQKKLLLAPPLSFTYNTPLHGYAGVVGVRKKNCCENNFRACPGILFYGYVPYNRT
ncbi:hypothetical protein [Chitinivibrio alkaliphilus]|uniref:Uncharacterized protein n=1 Tax=Chitinivibrio alkaliphilus ACht1 TaxID=1313304 RepID=U7DDX9_9BACT|nr:hypothetical protein [Chitinivibrio alkaliphilus]ERP39111.1 hypothetical protein CALK_0277 [Chitinivibrio alkaliphilus ACht1]